MADNEWAGHREGRIMEELAKEYAGKYADKRPLVMEVWEHGGWFHTYYFGEEAPEGHRLYTANDAAPLAEKSREILERLKGAESAYLGSIRRTKEEAGNSK